MKLSRFSSEDAKSSGTSLKSGGGCVTAGIVEVGGVDGMGGCGAVGGEREDCKGDVVSLICLSSENMRSLMAACGEPR